MGAQLEASVPLHIGTSRRLLCLPLSMMLEYSGDRKWKLPNSEGQAPALLLPYSVDKAVTSPRRSKGRRHSPPLSVLEMAVFHQPRTRIQRTT